MWCCRPLKGDQDKGSNGKRFDQSSQDVLSNNKKTFSSRLGNIKKIFPKPSGGRRGSGDTHNLSLPDDTPHEFEHLLMGPDFVECQSSFIFRKGKRGLSEQNK